MKHTRLFIMLIFPVCGVSQLSYAESSKADAILQKMFKSYSALSSYHDVGERETTTEMGGTKTTVKVPLKQSG